MTTLELLKLDRTGLETYDYIVNNLDGCEENMPFLTENLLRADSNGQFLTSTAIFLNSVDKEQFKIWIDKMVKGAIDKDRERRYIGLLLEALWGPDYSEKSDTLNAADDNFRRIYKRIFPKSAGKNETI